MRRTLLGLLLVAACDRGTTSPPPDNGTGTPAATRSSAPLDLSQGLLVADWDAEVRSQLESMVSERRAIVLAIAGGQSKLLVDCRGPSARLGDEAVYTFRAGRREEHGTVDGSTLDATHVGTLDITGLPRDAARLTGECGGATHVVRGIEIGAYELSSSTSSQKKVEVPLGGGGVIGGSTSSTTSESSKGGDRAACDGPESPPARCRAAIRLHLQALAR